jgi:hypothetical protein
MLLVLLRKLILGHGLMVFVKIQWIHSLSGQYTYKDKALNPEEQIIDNSGNLGRMVIQKFLCSTALSYDEFKEKINLEDDKNYWCNILR